MTSEVPVWVSGQQMWVRGIDRKTTCSDLIAALLGRPDDGYALIERWRRVERPLGGDTRLLKLWTAWGDAQSEVRFSLRRVADDDSGRGSPGSASGRRRKHHRSKHPAPTLHPKRLAKTQSIERLLKLILVQGETIHSQLQRLHEREDQIEHLEDETHRVRVGVLGSNYLLETYLKDSREEEEKAEDSGVVTEGVPSENTSTPTGEDEPTKDDGEATVDEDIEAEINDLQKRIEIWEKIVKVNKRLEREEESLVRLYVSVRREATSASDEAGLVAELDRVLQENEMGAKELQYNSTTLNEADSAIELRRRYLRRLQCELKASEEEAGRLKMSSEAARKCSREADSNSDTGLSSLHSSSEEGTYVLDTLV